MSLATLIPLVLKASIVLNVVLLGLDARPRDVIDLVRSPGKLTRSLLSIYILMPLFVGVGVAIFELHPAVEIALLALAVSPIPPLLPKKTRKAGARPPMPSVCWWRWLCWRSWSCRWPSLCSGRSSVGRRSCRRWRW